jgi:hypothetical protein
LFTERFKQVLYDPLHRCYYDISIGIGGSFESMERRDVYHAWEIQLEGLRRRVPSEDTWAARVRRANKQDHPRCQIR